MPARKVNGRWYVDAWIDVPGQGKRLRRKSPIQTKKGAERYEQEFVESALSSGEERYEEEKPSARTFRDLAVEFMERHVRVQCKYATFVSYESILDQHLVPHFGMIMIDQISGRDIAAFQAKLVRSGRSPGTVRNIVTVLSSALHVAKDWGYLETVPSIRLPRKVPTRFRFLSVDECLQVEDAATRYWRPMIHFARKTGLRIGEITPCDWEQINFDNATVNVDRAIWRKRLDTPKGGLAGSWTSHATRCACCERCGFNTGVRRGGWSFRARWAESVRRPKRTRGSGAPPVARAPSRSAGTCFVIRSRLTIVKTGAPIPVVQALLGHTDIQLTMRYAHLSPGQTANAVQRLDLESDRDSSWHYLGIGRTEAQPKARKSE